MKGAQHGRTFPGKLLEGIRTGSHTSRVLWIPGDRLALNGQTYQRGPLFAQWEAPAEDRPGQAGRHFTPI